MRVPWTYENPACAEVGERFGTWGGLTAVKRTKIRRLRGITLPREEHVA